MQKVGLFALFLILKLSLSAGTTAQFRTPLGNMDVELFDEDKPITVQNFIRYVESGAYTNMIFHRWVSRFVIQGGGFRVINRGTTNVNFAYVSNFGNITNEYNVGPHYSNVYGTIAMAKVDGNPHSASSQWFFNLTNNSANLNNQNGGFTVFGRVIKGTNVLHRFNLTNAANGMYRATSGISSELPVLSKTPGFEDLVYVNIVLSPIIRTQPQSQTAFTGSAVGFSVGVSNSLPLFYQWWKGSSPIDGATNSAYGITDLQTNDAGSYFVVVSNAVGTITSSNAVLEVIAPGSEVPVITAHPQGDTIWAGHDVTFSVAATSPTPLSFQWWKNESPINGATNSSHTLTFAYPTNGGNYFVVVNNAAGSAVSSNAVLEVLPALPNIDFQPASQTASLGAAVTLGIVAYSETPLNYQWYKANVRLTGATNSIYTISSLATNHAGSYWVGVSNMWGGYLSSAATVTVLPLRAPQFKGKTFLMTATNSTGIDFTNGTFRLSLATGTNSSYRLMPVTGGTTAANGNYSQTYQIATNVFLNLSTNLGVVLNFDTPTTGSFISTNQTGDMQSGTFVLGRSPADFSKDGLGDFLFQNTSGALSVWRMDGTNFLGSGPVRKTSPPTGWRVGGTGDFDGDGNPDILLQQTSTSKLMVWLMNGTNVIRTATLRKGTAPGTAWRVVSAADFNSDGKPDILMESSARKLMVWMMNGTNYTSTVNLKNGTAANVGWTSAGVGDFDGDDHNDILFRHTDGRLAAWRFSNASYLNAVALQKGPAASKPCGAGDINNDGRTDIIFQKSDGSMTGWFLDRTVFQRSGPLKKAAGWSLVSPR